MGAGTADSSATGATAAAGAEAVAGPAGCCCAQAGMETAISADNTAPASARRGNATGDGKERFFFIGKESTIKSPPAWGAKSCIIIGRGWDRDGAATFRAASGR
ncbi:hypothetical protein BPNSA17_19060 [Bordetella petrii]